MFDLTHSDLRRSLIWVLKSIESITCEANKIYPKSSNRQSPLLERPSSELQTSLGIKRKLSPLNTDIERVVHRPSPHSGYLRSFEGLSNAPLCQDHKACSVGELVPPPSSPIFPISRSTPMTEKCTPAYKRESNLPWPFPINQPPRTDPSILPTSLEKAAYLTRFHDLHQHINTGSPVSETPQRECDDPLSALSQAQTRIAILGRKCQACDAEISSLTKERSISRAQVRSLEFQLQEVQERIVEAQRQSATKEKQYVDIMAMASKIQIQGDLNMQKWKAEKEEWQQERQILAQRLAVLQHENKTLS